jgi:hypothetical protein
LYADEDGAALVEYGLLVALDRNCSSGCHSGSWRRDHRSVYSGRWPAYAIGSPAAERTDGL